MKQIKFLQVRRGLAVLLALSMLLSVLTACGGQAPGNTGDLQQAEEPAKAPSEAMDEPEPALAPEPEPEPEPDPVELALEQYRIITSQADTYDYDAMEEPTGDYWYALVRMTPDGVVPALLLKQDTTFGISSILTFQYDTGSGAVTQASDTLSEGAASAGGYRGGLSAAGDGYGLLSTEFSSGTGEGFTFRMVLDGDKLRSDVIWQGNIFEDTDTAIEEIGTADIDWHNVSDTSALASWTPGAPPSASTAPAEPEPEPSAEPVTDGDRIVFTGTLGSYSYTEVLTLQEISEPNPGSDRGETYWLIVLDTPQNMTLCSIGSEMGTYEGEVRIVNVTGADGLEQYDGQKLTVSIDAGHTWWPSDTSLPLGQPGTTDVHILQ